jgi:cell wall-associated NlpC family hydrolase
MTTGLFPRTRLALAALIIYASLLAGCALVPSRAPESPAALPAEHPAAIVSQVALSMVGVPYRFGGASPEGFDCSGLVYYAHFKAGVPVPRTAADQLRESMRVPDRQLRPGDLLFFDTSWRAGHVGIYVGNGEFVHAPSSGKRVTRESLEEGYYARRLKEAGRLTGP